jgi:hypothetical protein
VEQISLILFATDFEDSQSKTTASNARCHTPQSRRGPLHTPADVVAAVRNNTLVPDTKLNALVTPVNELVRERGYAKYETIQNFPSVRYKRVQIMELLLGIALKSISNYLDHISPAPLDEA